MPTLNVNPLTIVVQTAAQWSVDATVYNERQILVTSDEVYTPYNFRKIKLGNGTQAWSALSYLPIDVILTLGISLQAQINNISASLVFGTTAGTFCEGNDSRLSDTRIAKSLTKTQIQSSLTGTTSNAVITSFLIPANTVQVGDWIMMMIYFGKSGAINTTTNRIYFNDTNDLTTPELMGTLTMAAANNYGKMTRDFFVRSSTETVGYGSGSTANTDVLNTGVAYSTHNIDWTIDQYFVIAGQLASAADTVTVEGCFLNIKR